MKSYKPEYELKRRGQLLPAAWHYCLIRLGGVSQPKPHLLSGNRWDPRATGLPALNVAPRSQKVQTRSQKGSSGTVGGQGGRRLCRAFLWCPASPCSGIVLFMSSIDEEHRSYKWHQSSWRFFNRSWAAALFVVGVRNLQGLGCGYELFTYRREKANEPTTRCWWHGERVRARRRCSV